MQSLVLSSINFGILVVFLAVKLRKPVREFIQQRYVTIRDEVQSVSEQLKTAQEKFSEFSAKLKTVEGEIRALRAQSEQDANEAKQRILIEGQQLANQIVADAKKAGNGLVTELRNQLYLELSNKVLDLAEKKLEQRLRPEHSLKKREEFLRQLETLAR